MDKTRVRLLPMFPFSVVCGGLELQCLRTQIALKAIGIDAELLDWNDPRAQYDILHVFGSTPNYYDICLHSRGKRRIVISAVIGARSVSRLRKLVWDGVSTLARLARTPTEHQRLRCMYHSADAVLCLNQLEADFVGVTYELPRERLHIVTAGVGEHCFSASPEPFVERHGVRDFVLFTGNIVRRKNPLMLARALAELGTKGVFIGGEVAAEKAYADSFAHFVDSNENLLWIGNLAHDAPVLASAYSACSVFCLPSASEIQSASALEAMAAGKPLILGDRPYAYQTPFELALKCRCDDTHSLKKCLTMVLKDPERYTSRLPESYTWRNVARATAAVYERILG